MLVDAALRRELGRSFAATLVVVLTVVLTMMLIRTLGQAAKGQAEQAEHPHQTGGGQGLGRGDPFPVAPRSAFPTAHLPFGTSRATGGVSAGGGLCHQ